MPNGVPVATVALNAAQNAGILAAQMIATSDPLLLKRIVAFKDALKNKVLEAADVMYANQNGVVVKSKKAKTEKKKVASKKK